MTAILLQCNVDGVDAISERGPTMHHPRLVLCAKGPLSHTFITSIGQRAAGQFTPISNLIGAFDSKLGISSPIR